MAKGWVLVYWALRGPVLGDGYGSVRFTTFRQAVLWWSVYGIENAGVRITQDVWP